MLFIKECKKLLRSVTFIIYSVLVVLMFWTQYWDVLDAPLNETACMSCEETKSSGDPELIMPAALDSLTSCYLSNSYICYPYGFFKSVHLNSANSRKIQKYITELSGLSSDEIEALKDQNVKYYISHGTTDYAEYNVEDVPLKTDVTYERFVEIMGDVNDILGGGSDYKPEALAYNFSQVEMTEEELKEQYNDFIEKDHISIAYGRLFSDYLGIDLAFVPVFVAAALITADRRGKMKELVYSRKVSSFKLVFTRFAALFATMIIPVFLCAVLSAAKIMYMYSGSDPSFTGFFAVSGAWLMPNIAMTTAVGMLVSEIFSAGAAILVQFIFWFGSLMMSDAALYGNIGKFTFICRHNRLMHRADFMANYDNFVFNRIFYLMLSLVMVLLTVFVYEMKRGGKFNGIVFFGKGGIFRRKA
ncbi:MAG: ABC transporter permease [Ruminococcus sp.]|uniref:ABC transporter permease n=1 Tax=Ruminococcus sp. TaxID=41978 RepID=UPI0025F123ED|nr:ABC transporter permease [Ruminococcus sp.]MCR5600770.1 ABC transporter permease [Ruminococcus sp.]